MNQQPRRRRNRKHHRLRNHDYASAGAYFLTFCTFDMKCFLSRVEADGRLILGLAGKIVEQEILRTEELRESVDIIEYVVMPNHVHILMTLSGVDAVGAPNSYQDHVKGAISSIIGAIKSQVTIRMRRRHDEPVLELWQESFHDHVVRDEADFARIRDYIINNPGNWAEDRYHPRAIERATERREAESSSHAKEQV